MIYLVKNYVYMRINVYNTSLYFVKISFKKYIEEKKLKKRSLIR